jgi:hypothetical protein
MQTATAILKKIITKIGRYFAMDDPEALADHVTKLSPRLASISLRVARTCGLQRGANNTLKLNRSDAESQEIVELIHRDAMATNVVRICALLEREQNVVSFQSVYKNLKNQKVKEILIQRQKASVSNLYSDMVCSSAIRGFDDFAKAYKSIFPPSTVFKRLCHFRNYYLAHIDKNASPTQITYDELDFVCNQILAMGRALEGFAPTQTVLYENDIETYAQRTEQMMVKAMNTE